MKFGFLLTLASFWLTGAGYAGCYNWEENDYVDPEFHLICFKDKCDITRASATCSNVHEVFTFYESGWHIGISDNLTKRFANWNEKELSVDEMKLMRCFMFSDPTLTDIEGGGLCWGE